MQTTAEGYGLGWLRDLPSIQDYSPDHDDIAPKLRALGQKKSVKKTRGDSDEGRVVRDASVFR
jgi:hypothetical protein